MPRRLILVAILLSAVACGGPTGPTGNSVIDIAGVWNYTGTLTLASGGECVGPSLQSSIGSRSQGTFSITQTGAVLTGTSRASATGLTCTYSGTAGQNAFALSVVRCDVDGYTTQCTNGTRRDIFQFADSINGSLSGSTLTGTEAESYNVFVSNTSTGVGVLILQSSFTATR